MEKVIRDGRVGVVISPGYGSGFSTWGAPEESIFDPKLIQLIEEEKFEEIREYMQSTYPDEYVGGVEDLVVAWVPEGMEFIIQEYDGAEHIMGKEDFEWIKA